MSYYTQADDTTNQLTPIGVEFDSVSVLESVCPSAFVFGSRRVAESDAVTAFESVRPFSPINPPAFGFYAQPVSLSAHPLTLVVVPAGPRIHSLDFEAVGPLAGVLSLSLGPRAHAVAVGFAVLPVAAVSATIVKIKPTTTCKQMSDETE